MTDTTGTPAPPDVPTMTENDRRQAAAQLNDLAAALTTAAHAIASGHGDPPTFPILTVTGELLRLLLRLGADDSEQAARDILARYYPAAAPHVAARSLWDQLATRAGSFGRALGEPGYPASEIAAAALACHGTATVHAETEAALRASIRARRAAGSA